MIPLAEGTPISFDGLPPILSYFWDLLRIIVAQAWFQLFVIILIVLIIARIATSSKKKRN